MSMPFENSFPFSKIVLPPFFLYFLHLAVLKCLSFIKTEILHNTAMYSTENKSGYGREGTGQHLAKANSASLIFWYAYYKKHSRFP